jgi:threonine aldolase
MLKRGIGMLYKSYLALYRKAMKMIDLRSDTVTKPCLAMRQAMAAAEVGDDVFGEDPTINKLEELVADILGKEAAVFVPSGTMSNQVAIRSLTEAGDEVLLEENSHYYYYEAGAPAALAGVSCRLLKGQNGIFTADDVLAALRPSNVHFPPSKVVCIENTHNRGGGIVWPIDKIEDVARAAKQAGLKMHLDGARLWNAIAASGISGKEYAKHFDTISVCFSKGLGAPVGSALAGTRKIIDRARRFRKQFGGGMRQAGIIAAGALYALENNRKRLADDHENARALAMGLSKIDGVEVNADNVQTNIVMAKVTRIAAESLTQKLTDRGIFILAIGGDTIRAVTHLGISADDIKKTVSAFEVISESR